MRGNNFLELGFFCRLSCLVFMIAIIWLFCENFFVFLSIGFFTFNVTSFITNGSKLLTVYSKTDSKFCQFVTFNSNFLFSNYLFATWFSETPFSVLGMHLKATFKEIWCQNFWHVCYILNILISGSWLLIDHLACIFFWKVACMWIQHTYPIPPTSNLETKPWKLPCNREKTFLTLNRRQWWELISAI